MEEIKQQKRGRPKKENAMKPGDLQEGLQRFTFICNKKIVERVRTQAKEKNKSAKDIMNEILCKHFKIKKNQKIDSLPMP